MILSLALLSAGALAALGFIVSNRNTVFPNVTVSGVSVGGLTLGQAADRLDGPMEYIQAARAVVVEFPGDNVLQITAGEAGLAFTGREAAEVAFAHGREGNFFTNTIAFLRAQFTPVDLDSLTFAPANRHMIRTALVTAAEEMDRLALGAYEVVEDNLVITNSRLAITFNEDTLADMIAESFQEGAHEPIFYNAQTSAPQPIDVAAIYEAFFAEPKNAIFDIDLGEPTEHVVGVSFDLAQAEQRLQTAAPGETVTIPLIITEPEVTTEYLREVLFRDILASSTTQLTWDEDRNWNIILAASKIHGLILNPGERFDFNTVVGHANAERGFRPGGAFAGTEVITAIGGGICQVASTLYHALLHTDLQINTRSNHSLTVAYLPLGMDAVIYYGLLTLTFTNTSPFPIRLDLYREGLDFTVYIAGTQTSPYRIVPEGVYINSVPFPTTYRDDPNMPAGTTQIITPGQLGHVVDVYQRFYNPDGTLARREFVARSQYQPVPQVVARGTGAAAEPSEP